MKKKNTKAWNDPDLLPEYDLSSLPILARGPGHQARQVKKRQVRLDDDVAEFFQSDEAVNEALRTLIRICQITWRPGNQISG